VFFLVILHEEFSDFALVEDQHFYYCSKAIEFLVDELIGNFKGYRIVNADE
jgi:hypothetical protein